MLTIFFDKYLIKELTEKEFREKTCCESDCEALTHLFVETTGETDLNSAKTSAEELVKKLDGIRRAFGIYYGEE